MCACTRVNIVNIWSLCNLWYLPRICVIYEYRCNMNVLSGRCSRVPESAVWTLHVPQKSPISPSKEPYISLKIALHNMKVLTGGCSRVPESTVWILHDTLQHVGKLHGKGGDCDSFFCEWVTHDSSIGVPWLLFVCVTLKRTWLWLVFMWMGDPWLIRVCAVTVICVCDLENKMTVTRLYVNERPMTHP